ADHVEHRANKRGFPPALKNPTRAIMHKASPDQPRLNRRRPVVQIRPEGAVRAGGDDGSSSGDELDWDASLVVAAVLRESHIYQDIERSPVINAVVALDDLNATMFEPIVPNDDRVNVVAPI